MRKWYKKPMLIDYCSGQILARLNEKYKTLVSNVEFKIDSGESLALIGETGSGKTIIAYSIMKLLPSNVKANEIKLFFDGQDLSKRKSLHKLLGDEIVYIPQNGYENLSQSRKVKDQIFDSLKRINTPKQKMKETALIKLRAVGFSNPEEIMEKYPFELSGGMAQRVVIAIALACRPDVLICDEPTTALDVTVQAQILDLIKELQKEYNFTTIFITHDLGVVAGIADRIGVMYGGQFIEIGTDEDIFYHSAHPYTWALLSSLPQLAVDNEPLVYIRGNPPVFTHEIAGDAFAPRSDYAMRIDTMIEPPMFKISETHYAKTWLLDPRAPKVKKPTIIRNLSERMKKTAESFLASSNGGENHE